jgi:hypothetical protein
MVKLDTNYCMYHYFQRYIHVMAKHNNYLFKVFQLNSIINNIFF